VGSRHWCNPEGEAAAFGVDGDLPPAESTVGTKVLMVEEVDGMFKSAVFVKGLPLAANS
jgi:hypothetical protein